MPGEQWSEHDLLTFERPPVQEVALSMQFAPETFDLETIGRFARDLHDALPERQRQPVLPRMVETFERATAPTSVQINFEPLTALPRTWFLSTDGVELVQLQHDRLTLNWRESRPGSEYPRYAQLRARYAELLKMLTTTLEEIGQRYAVDLCEVTYVNTVEMPGENDHAAHPPLADIINRVAPRPEDAFLPPAEDAQLVVRWRIPGSEVGKVDSPAGRLYLQTAPGIKPQQLTPIYLVNVTAHVIPATGEVDDAFHALDVGHRWAVLGFKDVTTTEMHDLWGLKERET